ncbi:AmmeMemoRadiSam system protein A [Mariprofundus erugo]|uniref:AmmeMemoRadiSam system protein A n=1 Tax=Mariprofundus erugo TaxID=2528639 RepID=A0A5R9GWC0_9PROT|nr:AmmeMemoRadiSam system protein A [Mariprofundus erugo]TLS69175.1 AmmeMemoRadiSam system protein A [Mariprofundus erugo]
MHEQGGVLPALARAAIAGRLGVVESAPEPPDFLQQPGACFVTLQIRGRLRGCIGSLEPYRRLIDDVQANAIAAAFEDPRFPALDREEYALLHIEVSVLSPMELLPAHDEAALWALLRPGIDGVVLKFGLHRATFLPQVWDQLPDPRQFMAHLKVKAGLPADFWDTALQIYRYTVSKYGEREWSDDG